MPAHPIGVDNQPPSEYTRLVSFSVKGPASFSFSAADQAKPASAQIRAEAKRGFLAALAGAMDESVISIEMGLGNHLFVSNHRLPPSSAISTRTDTNSPPAIVFVQPVNQSFVLAGRSRSIVIPPRMFGHSPRRGSHLPVSVPLPMRSAMVGSRQIAPAQVMYIIPVGADLGRDLNLDDAPI
jgi:hypothetical protein